MTLGNTLQERLSEWRPAEGRQSLAVADPDGAWAAHLTVDRADAVGCLLWEVSAARTAPAPARETLRAWAERIPSRVTGLLEPLKVLEVDEARGEALLRSDGPSKRGGSTLYYEVHLTGTGGAVIRRYRTHLAGGKREQVAFALTHEALAKLLDDLTVPA